MSLRQRTIGRLKQFKAVRFAHRTTLKIVSYGIRAAALLLPLDDTRIVFETFNGRQFSDSPRAIFEHIIQTDQPFKIVWVFRDTAQYSHLAHNYNVTLVRYKSLKYFYHYARAKYWVTNAMLPLYITKRKSQVLVQCWHGTPLKKLRADIIETTTNATNSYKDFVYKNRKDARRYDMMLSPSQFASDKFNSAFELETLHDHPVIFESGYPRNDVLTDCTPDTQDTARRQLGIPPGKKVLLYTPTWRDDHYDVSQGFTHRLGIDWDYMFDHLSREYVVLFRTHYLIANSFDFEKYQGFIVDVSALDEVSQLYIAADALLTDYSSTFFDFNILDKPTLFYMHDLDTYRDQVRGLYVPTDELPQSIPGIMHPSVDALINSLQNLSTYTERTQELRDHCKTIYNYLDDGQASERVVNRMLQIGQENATKPHEVVQSQVEGRAT